MFSGLPRSSQKLNTTWRHYTNTTKKSFFSLIKCIFYICPDCKV